MLLLSYHEQQHAQRHGGHAQGRAGRRHLRPEQAPVRGGRVRRRRRRRHHRPLRRPVPPPLRPPAASEAPWRLGRLRLGRLRRVGAPPAVAVAAGAARDDPGSRGRMLQGRGRRRRRRRGRGHDRRRQRQLGRDLGHLHGQGGRLKVAALVVASLPPLEATSQKAQHLFFCLSSREFLFILFFGFFLDQTEFPAFSVLQLSELPNNE